MDKKKYSIEGNLNNSHKNNGKAVVKCFFMEGDECVGIPIETLIKNSNMNNSSDANNSYTNETNAIMNESYQIRYDSEISEDIVNQLDAFQLDKLEKFKTAANKAMNEKRDEQSFIEMLEAATEFYISTR